MWQISWRNKSWRDKNENKKPIIDIEHNLFKNAENNLMLTFVYNNTVFPKQLRQDIVLV